MDSIITESGMNFIADNAFHIEKSTLYATLGNGVRSVEFVCVKDDSLLFVEAKTTFPNPNNPSAENRAKFKKEAEDICKKSIHSLNLFLSVEVGVAEYMFTNDFVLPEKVLLALVLVIKNHEPQWRRPIKAELIAALPSYLKKIWKPTVFVINHETATKQQLTAPNAIEGNEQYVRHS